MRKLTTSLGKALLLTFLLAGYCAAVVFMPEGRADGFLNRLPSSLSQDVNQKVVKETKTVMVHQPLESSQKGEDLRLEAEVTGRPAEAMVVLHYRHQRGKPFFTREMGTIDDSLFSYTLPGYLLSDESVEYYLEVISASQVYAQSGSYFQPHRVRLTSKAGGLQYLLWGSLVAAGIFMLSKMGPFRKKASPKKPGKTAAIRKSGSLAARRVSPRITR